MSVRVVHGEVARSTFILLSCGSRAHLLTMQVIRRQMRFSIPTIFLRLEDKRALQLCIFGKLTNPILTDS